MAGNNEVTFCIDSISKTTQCLLILIIYKAKVSIWFNIFFITNNNLSEIKCKGHYYMKISNVDILKNLCSISSLSFISFYLFFSWINFTKKSTIAIFWKWYVQTYTLVGNINRLHAKTISTYLWKNTILFYQSDKGNPLWLISFLLSVA